MMLTGWHTGWMLRWDGVSFVVVGYGEMRFCVDASDDDGGVELPYIQHTRRNRVVLADEYPYTPTAALLTGWCCCKLCTRSDMMAAEHAKQDDDLRRRLGRLRCCRCRRGRQRTHARNRFSLSRIMSSGLQHGADPLLWVHRRRTTDWTRFGKAGWGAILCNLGAV